MFDRVTNVCGRTEHVSYTKEIHEYRAPTDESLKILQEMRDKTMEEIVGKIALSGSMGIVDVVAVVHNSVRNLTTTLHYKFSVNGEEMSGELDCPRVDWIDPAGTSIGVISDLLIKDMSEKVAKHYSERIVCACLTKQDEVIKFDI